MKAVWHWFTDFRRTRPFWGGLWLALGGWAIMSLTFAPIAVVAGAGFGGVAGYLLGGGMVLFGLAVWVNPALRHVMGVLGVAFAIASLVGSNLGGFLVGMLLGILGGAMTFGWGPKREPKRAAAAEGTPAEEAPAEGTPAGGTPAVGTIVDAAS